MARFLIGWEIGASPDLLVDVADIALALLRRGHEVRMAAADPVGLASVVDPALLSSILPSPMPPMRPDLIMRPPKEGGFADKLFAQGFNSPTVLSGLVSAWQNLIYAVTPDVVLSIGAPVLALATRGRLPLLVAGSAESLPPPELGTWPRLHANIAPSQTDDRLVAIAQSVAEAHGTAPVKQATDILRGDHVIVYGMPQIDPYVALRQVPAAGPLRSLPPPVVPAGKPAMLAVLDVHHPEIETLVMALTDFGGTPVHVHIRGMTVPMYNFLAQSPGIVLHARLDDALAQAADTTFVLHHATARTAAICIGMGVPQALLPFTIEQNAVADMLQRFNAGMRLGLGTDPTPAADSLAVLFRNIDQVQNAQHLARQIALKPPAAAMDGLVTAAERLVRS